MKKAVFFSTITLIGLAASLQLIAQPAIKTDQSISKESVQPRKAEDLLINPDENPSKPGYEFYGRHLILNFKGCDSQALLDEQKLKQVMKEAIDASGATILNTSEYTFDPHGLTMVFLLSESHASIHTYPEHRGCFLDLFTCGTSCSAARFEEVVAEYLQPEHVDRLFVERS